PWRFAAVGGQNHSYSYDRMTLVSTTLRPDPSLSRPRPRTPGRARSGKSLLLPQDNLKMAESDGHDRDIFLAAPGALAGRGRHARPGCESEPPREPAGRRTAAGALRRAAPIGRGLDRPAPARPDAPADGPGARGLLAPGGQPRSRLGGAAPLLRGGR